MNSKEYLAAKLPNAAPRRRRGGRKRQPGPATMTNVALWNRVEDMAAVLGRKEAVFVSCPPRPILLGLYKRLNRLLNGR